MTEMTLAACSERVILVSVSAESLPAASPPFPGTMDPRAWVISEYPARVARRVAYLYGLSVDDATDLAQDISVSALRMGDMQLKPAWFFVTARNLRSTC